MIKLKPYSQTPGLCGPASEKMVMERYGVSASEAELAELAGASQEKGASPEGLVKAAKFKGFDTFLKTHSTINDLRYFIRRKMPVIVDWFCVDCGHYSVVADVTEKHVILVDPSPRKFLFFRFHKRKIPIKNFRTSWFDFPGEALENPNDMIIRLMLVIFPSMPSQQNMGDAKK